MKNHPRTNSRGMGGFVIVKQNTHTSTRTRTRARTRTRTHAHAHTHRHPRTNRRGMSALCLSNKANLLSCYPWGTIRVSPPNLPKSEIDRATLNPQIINMCIHVRSCSSVHVDHFMYVFLCTYISLSLCSCLCIPLFGCVCACVRARVCVTE